MSILEYILFLIEIISFIIHELRWLVDYYLFLLISSLMNLYLVDLISRITFLFKPTNN